MINKKILYTVLGIVAVLVLMLIYRIITKESPLPVLENTNATNTVTVFEPIELTDQKDFKLIGQKLYRGSGFEPGFAFDLTLAGSKFGIDLTSKYGESRYVGYIDLDIPTQTKTQKIFVGKLLDIENKMVDAKFTILTESCGMPSGEEVDYKVFIDVGDEKINGCAQMMDQ